MKKLKCKKEYGTFFYKKVYPNGENDLDGPIYELYDYNETLINIFGCYSDMKYYVETGIYL